MNGFKNGILIAVAIFCVVSTLLFWIDMTTGAINGKVVRDVTGKQYLLYNGRVWNIDGEVK